MLKIIDISSHQTVQQAGMDGIDGVIVKVSQGTGYVNEKADAQYQLAKSKGRLLGIFHYAGGKDPKAEAEYFVNHAKGYFKEAIPFLDWEQYQNSAWGNTNWAKAFVERVKELTGVTCGIYVQASSINQVANCASMSALWVAGYPHEDLDWSTAGDMPYNISPWEAYTIWQFTGSPLDKNWGNLTAEAWKKIANPTGAAVEPTPTPETPSTTYDINALSIEQMATDVIAGKLGDGDTRKAKLQQYWTGVMAVVNQRLGVINGDQAVDILVAETKAGVMGNDAFRKTKLGSYWSPVQAKINAGSNVGTQRIYVVKSGDTLSGIGAKVGVAWKQLSIKNNIPAPYTIYPGQKIKY